MSTIARKSLICLLWMSVCALLVAQQPDQKNWTQGIDNGVVPFFGYFLAAPRIPNGDNVAVYIRFVIFHVFVPNAFQWNTSPVRKA